MWVRAKLCKASQYSSRWGAGDAAHFALYLHWWHLLLQVYDQQGAASALSHAIALPRLQFVSHLRGSAAYHKRLTILGGLVNFKEGTRHRQGALKDLSEADALRQLSFDQLKQLGQLHSTHADIWRCIDAAAAVVTVDIAAVMEPSHARVRQQRERAREYSSGFLWGLGKLASSKRPMWTSIKLYQSQT